MSDIYITQDRFRAEWLRACGFQMSVVEHDFRFDFQFTQSAKLDYALSVWDEFTGGGRYRDAHKFVSGFIGTV